MALHKTTKPKTFKWSLDFTKNKHEKTTETVSPPGYSHLTSFNSFETIKNGKPNKLIIKKSWDIALDPLKQIPMNLFIMYMAGNSISIFPVIMVTMLIVRPVKLLYKLNKTFKCIEGTRAWLQKFIFIIGNLINIIFAAYKCQTMGLLPLHESDWLAFVVPPTRMEFSGGGLSFS